VHDGKDSITVVGGWALRRPIQRAGMPRIDPSFLTASQNVRPDKINQEEHHTNAEDVRPNVRNQVRCVESEPSRVRINTSRHTQKPAEVHRQKRDVEADHSDPEVPFPDAP
jgi:hypothetical protein